MRKKIIYTIIFTFFVLISFSKTTSADGLNFGYLNDQNEIVACGYETQEKCDTYLKSLNNEFSDKECIINIKCNDSYVPIVAQTENSVDGDYTLLAPFSGETETIATNDIGAYFNRFFLLAISLAGVLSVVMIVIGGIQWMGEESIFAKTEAKKRITSAILGLIIALGSYALLNTINPDLLGKNGLSISQVSITLDPNVYGDTAHSAVDGYYCNGRAKAGEAWPSDDDKRTSDKLRLLANNNIKINHTNCTYVGQKNCTSLYELNTAPLINFKKTICPNCDVVITGGTECWLHSPKTEHYKGNAIVDLDDTDSVTAYVESGTKEKVKDSNYYLYTTKDGIKFLDELTHYHIVSW